MTADRQGPSGGGVTCLRSVGSDEVTLEPLEVMSVTVVGDAGAE